LKTPPDYTSLVEFSVSNFPIFFRDFSILEKDLQLGPMPFLLPNLVSTLILTRMLLFY